MNKFGNVLAVLGIVAISALVILNWSSLMIPAPLNLGIAQVQAPLGVIVLGLGALLVAVFLVAYLHHQIGTLLESRKLHKEIQRIQEDARRMQSLADKAEASRIENLQQLIATEFRLLNERLNAVSAGNPPATARPPAAEEKGELLSMKELVTGRERP